MASDVVVEASGWLVGAGGGQAPARGANSRTVTYCCCIVAARRDRQGQREPDTRPLEPWREVGGGGEAVSSVTPWLMAHAAR